MVGDVHMEEEEFQEAVHAYSRAEQKAKDMDDEMEAMKELQQKLKRANALLEQSKKKQYYKVRREEGRRT